MLPDSDVPDTAAVSWTDAGATAAAGDTLSAIVAVVPACVCGDPRRLAVSECGNVNRRRGLVVVDKEHERARRERPGLPGRRHRKIVHCRKLEPARRPAVAAVDPRKLRAIGDPDRPRSGRCGEAEQDRCRRPAQQRAGRPGEVASALHSQVGALSTTTLTVGDSIAFPPPV